MILELLEIEFPIRIVERNVVPNPQECFPLQSVPDLLPQRAEFGRQRHARQDRAQSTISDPVPSLMDFADQRCCQQCGKAKVGLTIRLRTVRDTQDSFYE